MQINNPEELMGVIHQFRDGLSEYTKPIFEEKLLHTLSQAAQITCDTAKEMAEVERWINRLLALGATGDQIQALISGKPPSSSITFYLGLAANRLVTGQPITDLIQGGHAPHGSYWQEYQ